MKILFVCEGNLIRSQMGEAFYNTLSASQNAASAGTAAQDWPGPSPRAIEVMNEIGIDIRGNPATRLTDEMVETADKIILFPTNFTPDYLPQLDKVELWDVIDPGYNKDRGMELVREVRDDIQKRVEELLGVSKDYS